MESRMSARVLHIYFILLLCNGSNCQLLDYLKSVGTYFGYVPKQEPRSNDEFLNQVVPYEVSQSDENFISEAAKLTGVALSALDSCQHRVVLKLQTSCDKMNDEQLAKMAVMLLNCQSSVEGRKIFPCTDEMSIKECTTDMDADMWNSYHLMSNRVRAVCYSVRQTQFRGLTEYTINRLMEAARNQLFNLDKISKDQQNLHELAQESLQSVAKGQEHLVRQQNDFKRAQLHSQLSIENNIQRLADEKRLIAETNDQLMQMTHAVQGKLELAASQLKEHSDESHLNHQELLDDLVSIQNKVQVIFQRIEDSSELLLKQSELAQQQYQVTVEQLAEVNATVHSLVSLVGGTRRALEERLAWINSALGGTDSAIERLYAILWHASFLLIAMITCAFLGAQIITRLIVAISLPLNLALTLHKSEHALDPITLTTSVGGCIIVQLMVSSMLALWHTRVIQRTVPAIKERLTPKKNRENNNSVMPDENYENESVNGSAVHDDYSYSEPPLSPTMSYLKSGYLPPRSRSRTPSVLNGGIKNSCSAKTRLGTPCKLTALSGRDFCYRHQAGDSIYAE
ncbi:hypothetical protein PPYR_01670 [Photinus pyralis]|uniref:Protein brambleberry n=1 Tax=Photinus pyralis TaxID=7054 RepID=A0A5N4B5R5_PHOPY|nr:protein brambleberry-like [Photinus pyralis]KAB0804700.1 hypothetical protein PPYR_01670 [Photinus pyralis]